MTLVGVGAGDRLTLPRRGGSARPCTSSLMTEIETQADGAACYVQLMSYDPPRRVAMRRGGSHPGLGGIGIRWRTPDEGASPACPGEDLRIQLGRAFTAVAGRSDLHRGTCLRRHLQLRHA